MKVVIVTEDSGVKLPKIDKFKGKIGRGVRLKDHEEFMKTLDQYDFDIPTNDIREENNYAKVLSDFARPAKLMFAGMFSEVRIFYEELKSKYDVSLFIISGRYGLVNAEKEIIPYDFFLENYDMIQELDERTNFYKQLLNYTNSSEVVLILLSRSYISYLFNMNLLKNVETKMIFVTSSDFKNRIIAKDNFFFQKHGVARLSKRYREQIRDILEEM